jgi:hypothetical protein
MLEREREQGEREGERNEGMEGGRERELVLGFIVIIQSPTT